MSHTIRYRSSRAEIWHWYWRAWRKKLWLTHVLLAAIIALVVAISKSDTLSLKWFVLSFFSALPLVTVALAAWPQLMFKSSERTLVVGPTGWSTQIGTISGSCDWAQVAAIQDTNDAVIITGVNGNALVIPSRAFQDAASRLQFVKDSQGWHREHVA